MGLKRGPQWPRQGKLLRLGAAAAIRPQGGRRKDVIHSSNDGRSYCIAFWKE